MRATQKALMAHGLDSDGAAQLAKDGWKVSKLKLASQTELRAIGSHVVAGDFVEPALVTLAVRVRYSAKLTRREAPIRTPPN